MNILVRNLAETVTKERLLKLFEPFGTVNSTCIVNDKVTGRSKGFGFVEMPNQDEAIAAIKALHHTRLANTTIRVKESKAHFGPEYFSQEHQPQEGEEQPGTVLDSIVNPGNAGTSEKPRGGKNNRRPFSSYAGREGGRREYQPRGGQRHGYQRSGEGNYRPASRYASGTTEKREYQPRSKGYRQWNTGEGDTRQHSRYPSREGGRQEYRSHDGQRHGYQRSNKGSYRPPRYSETGERQEYKPRSESYRSWGPGEGRREYQPRGEQRQRYQRSGEGNYRQGSRYSSGTGERREYQPRGEQRQGYQRSGEGNYRQGSRYSSGTGEKREYQPRGEQGYRPHRSGAGASRPDSRFRSKEYSGKRFHPRSGKPPRSGR